MPKFSGASGAEKPVDSLLSLSSPRKALSPPGICPDSDAPVKDPLISSSQATGNPWQLLSMEASWMKVAFIKYDHERFVHPVSFWEGTPPLGTFLNLSEALWNGGLSGLRAPRDRAPAEDEGLTGMEGVHVRIGVERKRRPYPQEQSHEVKAMRFPGGIRSKGQE